MLYCVESVSKNHEAMEERAGMKIIYTCSSESTKKKEVDRYRNCISSFRSRAPSKC